MWITISCRRKLRSLESDLGISKSSAYVAKDKFIDAVLQCPDLDIQFPSSVLMQKALKLKLPPLYSKAALGLLTVFSNLRSNRQSRNLLGIREPIFQAWSERTGSRRFEFKVHLFRCHRPRQHE